MQFDHNKLKGRIVEVIGGQAKFALKLGVSEKTLSKKLNNKVPWNQREISSACKILNIDSNSIDVYFFNQKV